MIHRVSPALSGLLATLLLLSGCGLMEELYGNPRDAAANLAGDIEFDVPIQAPISLGSGDFAIPGNVEADTVVTFPPIYIATDAIRSEAQANGVPLDRIDRIEIRAIRSETTANTLNVPLLETEMRIGGAQQGATYENALPAAILPRFEPAEVADKEAELITENRNAIGTILSELEFGIGFEPAIQVGTEQPSGTANLVITLTLAIIPRI